MAQCAPWSMCRRGCGRPLCVPRLLECLHADCHHKLEEKLQSANSSPQVNILELACPVCHELTPVDKQRGVISLELHRIEIIEDGRFNHINKCALPKCQKEVFARCFQCCKGLCKRCCSYHDNDNQCLRSNLMLVEADDTDAKTCLFHPQHQIEYYCHTCSRQHICTQCFEESHTGHFVESLNILENLSEQVRDALVKFKKQEVELEERDTQLNTNKENADVEQFDQAAQSVLENKAEEMKAATTLYNKPLLYRQQLSEEEKRHLIEKHDSFARLASVEACVDAGRIQILPRPDQRHIDFVTQDLQNNLDLYPTTQVLQGPDWKFEMPAVEPQITRQAFGFTEDYTNQAELLTPFFRAIQGRNDGPVEDRSSLFSRNSLPTEVYRSSTSFKRGAHDHSSARSIPRLTTDLTTSLFGIGETGVSSSRMQKPQLKTCPDIDNQNAEICWAWMQALHITDDPTSNRYSSRRQSSSSQHTGSSSSRPQPPRCQKKRDKMALVMEIPPDNVQRSGLAVNPKNGNILVAGGNSNCVQFFSEQGQLLGNLYEPGKKGRLVFPNGVAVSPLSGNIVISERPPSSQIQIFNSAGIFIRNFGRAILKNVRDLTVDEVDQVVVLESKVAKRVTLFSEFGETFSQFNLGKEIDFPCSCAAMNGEVYVADNGGHQVVVYDYWGQYLRNIGGPGLTNHPVSVNCTSEGLVVIADNYMNFKISIFDRRGTFVDGYGAQEKLDKCQKIVLLNNKRIVFLSYDHSIYVYKYLRV